jgi:hypothetical protein
MGSNPSLSANSMKSTTYLGSFQAFRGIFQGALIAIGKRKGGVHCAAGREKPSGVFM